MTKKLKFSIAILLVALLACCLAACQLQPCTSICPVCDGCTNPNCLTHPAKCTCADVPTPDTCTALCSVCGGCKDDSCTQHSTKCTCTPTPTPDVCTSLCSVCGNCTDATCTQHTQKCTCAQQPPRQVKFLAINDFHGAVNLFPKVAGQIESLADGNTVIINSGDMFQGSLQSNSNYGRLLTDCMSVVGFDCLTLGNHEFDWGLQKLAELKAASQTPFLAANLYHWNAATKTWGTFASEYADKYVVKTLSNGLKVGIIGIIGSSQITSISSQLVQTVGFKNPAEVIPDLAAELRSQGCDVIALSAHTGQETFLQDRSFDVTDYCNVVFCAHTHRRELTEHNGVAFIQGGSYGNTLSQVTLSVDNGTVTTQRKYNQYFSSSWQANAQVQQMVDENEQIVSQQASQVVANLSGSLDYYTDVPRLVSRAMVHACNKAGYQVDLAICLRGRADLPSGTLTYEQLFQCLPFDNTVYVARVSGKDVLREAGYDGNEVWRVTEQPIMNDNYNYYTVAVIDYMLYHQNSNRDYNYFPSAFNGNGQVVAALMDDGVIYNYRQITQDFLSSCGTVNSADYTQISNYTNKNLLTQAVTLQANAFAPQANGIVANSVNLANRLFSQAILPPIFGEQWCNSFCERRVA